MALKRTGPFVPKTETEPHFDFFASLELMQQEFLMFDFLSTSFRIPDSRLGRKDGDEWSFKG
jgi:hypothetical protein